MTMRIMLDTNAFDYIKLNGYQDRFVAAVDSKRFELCITHVQRDEIAAIPDTKNHIRASHQSILSSATVVGPGVTIWTNQAKSGSSIPPARTPSQNKYLAGMEYMNPNSSVMTLSENHDRDAIIAETAAEKSDVFVTDDQTLRKHFLKGGSAARVMSTLEFLNQYGAFS